MEEIKITITGELINPEGQSCSSRQIHVAEIDFECQLSWSLAKSECSKLGNEWRLPTYVELEVIHKELHKKGKGNFKDSQYWSSMEGDEYESWVFDFNHGSAGYNETRFGSFYVRAVRSI